MQDKGGSGYQFRIDRPSPEVNGESMKSTGQSQASGPVTTGRRRPLGRDRIGASYGVRESHSSPLQH